MKLLFVAYLSLISFSILQVNESIKGTILITANPQWEYAPFDPAWLTPRSRNFPGEIFIFQDSTFDLITGYFNGTEDSNIIGLNEGDGHCIYKGTYEENDEYIIVKYQLKECHQYLLNSENTNIKIDTLRGPFISNGGLFPYPVFKSKKNYFISIENSIWHIKENELVRIKKEIK